MSKNPFRLAVYIGRFQPPHLAHIAALRYGLSIADNVQVILGNHNSPRTVKNPWTLDERMDMIRLCLTEEENARVQMRGQRNYESDLKWTVSVQNIVNESCSVGKDSDVVLIGLPKDATTAQYLNFFPQWAHHHPPNSGVEIMHATDIRHEIFGAGELPAKMLPAPVLEWLAEWMKNSKDAEVLMREHEYIQDYRAQWASAPFPPTFVTVDAVVIRSGHVLMVKRKVHPGKGLFAIPGGFVGQDERLADAALRELQEETGLPPALVSPFFSESRVFDNPARSLRGRSITHAYLYDMGNGALPKVKGGDDAETAFWMPVAEAAMNGSKIFEDHLEIIEYFTNRV